MPEELIDQLDPARDYGERTLAEVKDAVRRGELILRPGMNLPVIVDAHTGKAVAGTGRPEGVSTRVINRSFVEKMLEERSEEFWEAAFRFAIAGDAKWGKIIVDSGIGQAVQDKGGGSGAADFLKILRLAAEATSTARVSSEVVE